jgi:hypothetical protein
MTEPPEIEDRWYWDRRTETALYPRRVDGDTVEFVTVWHREEVEDATDAGALVPVEEIGLDRTETTFDLLDSFRTPEHVEREAREAAGNDEGSEVSAGEES